MYIIEVIPLTILPPSVPQVLSYFFNEKMEKGSIIEVPVGNRRVPAAVISCSSIEEQKGNLKKSYFQLKKAYGIISDEPLIRDIQFKIALWLSRNYYAPLSLCLKTVLPSFFLKKNYVLSSMYHGNIKNQKKGLSHNTKYSTPNTVLLSNAKDLIKNIEPEIKKNLKAKKQTLIIVPEISTIKYLYEYFAGYHETVSLYGKLSVKKLYGAWDKISSGEAEIIIGTRQALFAPYANLGLIILEDPANEAYKSDMSPKYNTPDLAEKISELYTADRGGASNQDVDKSVNLVYISQIPDIKRFISIKNGAYKLEDQTNPKKHEIKTIDMVQEIKTGNYSIFSRELTDKIFEYSDRKILLFSTRKGYSGSLMCENCGFIFKCPSCSVPMRIHAKIKDSILICHRCSLTKSMPQGCPNCQSYKLKKSGLAGSQKIEEGLLRLFPDDKARPEIFIFDSDIAKNAASAKPGEPRPKGREKTQNEILEKIDASKSCICIATQLIFSHRYNREFNFIGIPNIDSLTTTPDFRAEEELFHQFYKLLDFSPKEIVIQSYNPNSQVLNYLVKEDYTGFYEKECFSRKLFLYPPFGRLIKLSFRDPDSSKAFYQARVLSEKLKMAIMQKKLDEKVKLLGPSPAFVEKEKGYFIYNIILKLALDENPDNILRYVPIGWSIDIDPKSIL